MFRELLWQWLPWIINKTHCLIETTTRAARAAYTEVTVPKEWAFLHGVYIPISIQVFQDIPDSIIRWRAQTNPPKFVESSTTLTTLKHISYLGLSIIIPGHDPIDLTDWVNEVKWIGHVEPNLTEIFMLWCCETGRPYFHLIPKAVAEIITEEGDIIQKGLNESLRSKNSSDVSQSEGQNSNRILDAVFSSSGC
jgi:hypothetical protein